MTVSISMTAQGAQPTPPATLRSNLIALVTAQSPGYTSNLPSSLIEDISSTDVGALVSIDQVAVDLVNSLTPDTSNDYIVTLQGAQIGLPQGSSSNSSAFVLFTGLPGYIIPKGFVVSDGTNQYTVQDGGVLSNSVACTFIGTINGTTLTVTGISGQLLPGDTITSGAAAGTKVTSWDSGTQYGNGNYTVDIPQTIGPVAMVGTNHGSANLYVVANNFGTWAIPANTITTLITSVPSGYPLVCTNQTTGVVAVSAETVDMYRARIHESMLAPAIGTLARLKANIKAIPGVQSRLVSVGGNSKIMVGGGDPYAVAGAIYMALFDIGDLSGSTVTAGITNSWSTSSGSIYGTVMTITGAVTGSVKINDIVGGVNLINPTVVLQQLTAISPAFPTGGGTGDYLINYSQNITPEALTGKGSDRNQIVSIIDYPDTYTILYVSPVSQTISIGCDWSTVSPNFTANLAISQAVTAAWVDYVNSITVGTELNIYTLQQLFLSSINAIVNPTLISTITISVSIDGVPTSPLPGTSLIAGDAEGYFITNSSLITLTRV